MRTIIKALIIVLFNLSVINASDLIKLNLIDFIDVIAHENDMTILIDKDIDSTFTILLGDDIDQETYQNIFIDILEKNDLVLVKKDKYYSLEYKGKNDLIVRSVKLKYLTFEDIKDILSLFKNSKYKFLENTKTLYISSTIDDFEIIKKLIAINDVIPIQYKVKITIIDTNIDKLKELGFEYIQNNFLDSNSNFFFNLLAYPFTVNSKISSSQSKNFNMFIKMLNQDTVSSLVSSPTLTIFNNKLSKFEVVKNIPFKEGSTVIDGDNAKTTETFKYKDVGLKINITPQIYKDSVFINLDLVSENILTSSSTPTTSKISIKNYFNLKKDEVLVLTGINQSQNISSIDGLPYLQDLPVLGWLFKKDKNTTNNTNMTILLELLDN